jgi:hypothetical protein
MFQETRFVVLAPSSMHWTATPAADSAVTPEVCPSGVAFGCSSFSSSNAPEQHDAAPTSTLA